MKKKTPKAVKEPKTWRVFNWRSFTFHCSEALTKTEAMEVARPFPEHIRAVNTSTSGSLTSRGGLGNTALVIDPAEFSRLVSKYFTA